MVVNVRIVKKPPNRPLPHQNAAIGFITSSQSLWCLRNISVFSTDVYYTSLEGNYTVVFPAENGSKQQTQYSKQPTIHFNMPAVRVGMSRKNFTYDEMMLSFIYQVRYMKCLVVNTFHRYNFSYGLSNELKFLYRNAHVKLLVSKVLVWL